MSPPLTQNPSNLAMQITMKKFVLANYEKYSSTIKDFQVNICPAVLLATLE